MDEIRILLILSSHQELAVYRVNGSGLTAGVGNTVNGPVGSVGPGGSFCLNANCL